MSGNGATGADPRTSSLLAEPVWTTPESWAEANHSLALLCRKYETSLAPAREQARRVRAALQALHPTIEFLCSTTCPACPDSCCVRAKVWLDFRDLLFLHLAGGPLPLHQLRRNLAETCLFLGLKGCTLPRLSRPWVCTWYLCPEQTNLLRKLPVEKQAEFHPAVQEVKEGRRKMEEEFMGAIVSSSCPGTGYR